MMRDWENQGFDAMICCAFPMPAIAPQFCSKVVPGKATRLLQMVFIEKESMQIHTDLNLMRHSHVDCPNFGRP